MKLSYKRYKFVTLYAHDMTSNSVSLPELYQQKSMSKPFRHVKLQNTYSEYTLHTFQVLVHDKIRHYSTVLCITDSVPWAYLRTFRSDLNWTTRTSYPRTVQYNNGDHLTGATLQYFKTHFDSNNEIATCLKAELRAAAHQLRQDKHQDTSQKTLSCFIRDSDSSPHTEVARFRVLSHLL
jgi:hypothetical protein